MTEGNRVEVRFYGALRSYSDQREVNRDSVAWLDISRSTSVDGALRRLGIADAEVSNVFRNGRLAARDDELRPGDRLGLFPSNMSLLYC